MAQMLLGRTFEEYCRYLLLEPDDLVGKSVLDVAGCGQFVLRGANTLGINVTSFDPIYSLPPEKIVDRSEPDLESVYRAIEVCRPIAGVLQKSRNRARIAQTRVHYLSLELQNPSRALRSGRAAEAVVRGRDV
jgi:hypothetical protein